MRRRRKGGLPGGATALAAIAALVAVLAGPEPATAQGLADYDYENLRLRGVGVDLGIVSPNDLDATVQIGARLDLGFLGPNIRLVPRVAYWDTELEEAEVRELADRLETLVEEQNPGQPRPTLDLGRVDRSAFITGVDLHWLPLLRETTRPYFGIGAELYFLNGEGPAIEDTFIEDALDLLTAGASAVGGVEVDVGGGFTAYGELRGTLVADANTIGLVAGLAFLSP